jgi:hypothetical protein
MKWRRAVAALVLGALALSTSGCSFLFVEPAKPVPTAYGPPRYNLGCTDGVGWPTADALVAALQAVRTVYAWSRSASDYRGQTLSRDADIGFGMLLTTLFTSSAIYGGTSVRECTRLKARTLVRDDDRPASEPRDDSADEGDEDEGDTAGSPRKPAPPQRNPQ